MPSPMIERIAIRMCQQQGIDPYRLATNLMLQTAHGLTFIPSVGDTFDSPRPAWRFFIGYATSALSALRDPTPEMEQVLAKAIADDLPSLACWHAAIDEAFK
jgi:hypothetical protein